jgi:DNA-binding winged helix-turn-helix (wHTH) protein
MENPAPNPKVIRLGGFEIDLEAGELRMSGVRLKLQDRPFQVLTILLDRPGKVETRKGLRAKGRGIQIRLLTSSFASTRPSTRFAREMLIVAVHRTQDRRKGFSLRVSNHLL